MHILSDDRIVCLHPELSRARHRTPAEFHEEEAVRVTTAPNRVQRKFDGRTNFTVSALVSDAGLVAMIRIVTRGSMSLQPNKAERFRRQADALVALQMLMRPEAFRLYANFPDVVCNGGFRSRTLCHE